ncbi:MAG: CPBP family intramembrane metalloprotease [Cocleimonas sp.]|nr:CPBP family intramembrane metalloprotease [Cocleimonas sp.]
MTNPTIQETNNKPPYWGFFATVGLGLVAFLIYGIIQAGILIGAAFNNGKLSLELLTSGDQVALDKNINDIMFNGDLLGLTGIPSTFIGVGLILLFIILRKTLTSSQYLDLRMPQQPLKTFSIWIGAMLLVFIGIEVVTHLIDHTPPEFMARVYGSTNNKIMLWITIAFAAPIFEEFLFRGFLLEGFRHSKLGDTGAVLLTSFLFAIIHIQYGWFEITTIFVIGIIFAVAKLKTNSLYVPIAMHMFMNLSASVLMEVAPELAK